MMMTPHISSSAMHSPLEQFEIKRLLEFQLGAFDLSFTNSMLWMLVGIGGIFFFCFFGIRKQEVIPGRWQLLVELLYKFSSSLLHQTVGKEGKVYFPFIFTLFLFILACNLCGMIPYSFTVTSHIAVTLTLALMVFIGVTVLGFVKNGKEFLRLFVPSGVSPFLLLLITPIEVLSYFIRPISLSVRLFANMTAGHILLKVFAAGAVALGGIFKVLALFPLVFMVALTALEIGIAFLQAYVFTILTCLYLKDALHPVH